MRHTIALLIISYRFFRRISTVVLSVHSALHLKIFTILKPIFSVERIIWIIERLFKLITYMDASATTSVTWVAYKCIFQGASPSDYSRVLIGALRRLVVRLVLIGALRWLVGQVGTYALGTWYLLDTLTNMANLASTYRTKADGRRPKSYK
jgi:hypothetical protein